MAKLKNTEPEIEDENKGERVENPVHIVLVTFRGKFEKRNFYPKEDVSHFEKKRLDNLVKRGLVAEK